MPLGPFIIRMQTPNSPKTRESRQFMVLQYYWRSPLPPPPPIERTPDPDFLVGGSYKGWNLSDDIRNEVKTALAPCKKKLML
jgi:hypothetical protein